ncbi:MAG: hypothetical protein IT307_00365 [Chloroflexi bacterium]|nr:hypothetical protein [Chloroflexota bacterium]
MFAGRLTQVLAIVALSASAGLAPLPANLTPTAVPPARAQESCLFSLGFKTLHDMVPDVVGSCLENERHNPENGDGLQRTTGGLLVWRKADNWTAFTDGTTTWVNGPLGLQSRPSGDRFPWEEALVPQPPTSAPLPPAARGAVQAAVTDAAKRAGVDPASVQVLSVEAHDWGDSSLGCREPGMAYSQIVTAGFIIRLQAGGRTVEYHSDRGNRVVTC